MTAADILEVTDRLSEHELQHAFDRKRVLITGARGFLGSAFTDLLASLGAEVIAVDRYALAAEMGAPPPKQRANVEHVDFDVTQTNGFPIHGRVDYILSLAAIASPVHYARRSRTCFDVIVNGTRNMLELAGQKGATLLLTSTSELYGDSGWSGAAMQEDHLGALDPWSVRGRAYDVPKLASEALASIFAAEGVKVRTVRYFNVYGPGLSRHDYRVMSKFIAAAIDGEPLIVHGAGPWPTRSFCYLTDALLGTLLVLLSKEKRPVNVGNPEEISMIDLAKLIAGMSGKMCRVDITEPPAEYVSQPRRRRPDIARLEALGFAPKVTLKDGLKRVLDWAIEAYVQEDPKK